MAVPDDLGETKVGKLDSSDTTGTNALDVFAFVSLVLVFRALGLGVPGWYKGSWVEEKVLWLDITGQRLDAVQI